MFCKLSLSIPIPKKDINKASLLEVCVKEGKFEEEKEGERGKGRRKRILFSFEDISSEDSTWGELKM